MKVTRKWVVCVMGFLSLILGMLTANSARASTCTQTNVNNGLRYYTATVTNFAPPMFDPNDFSVGDTIYRSTGTVSINNSNGNPITTCTGAQQYYWISGEGAPTNNIYPTSVSGVGLRISNFQGIPWPILGNWLPTDGKSIQWNSNFVVNLELVKTGAIPSGGTLQGRFGKYSVGSTTGALLVVFSWNNPIVITPQARSCTVQNSNIVVPLGTIASSSFTGIGTTSPASSFNIQVNCASGVPGKSTNVYVTLTDSTNPGNRSGNLSLTTDSGAKGVAIEVLSGSTLVQYGPDSSSVGNLNQWSAGTITQGAPASITIPLSARYIQIGTSVTGGVANGVATFTMSYQ